MLLKLSHILISALSGSLWRRAWNHALICTISLVALTKPAVVLGADCGDNDVVADVDSIISRIASRCCDRIEGVWWLTDNSAIVAVESTEIQGEYAVMVVDAADRCVMPGSRIATISIAANHNKYRIEFVDDDFFRQLGRPRSFVIDISDNRYMRFVDAGKSLRINWFRALPYPLRGIATIVDSTPRDLDGAVRLGPDIDGKPIRKVVL